MCITHCMFTLTLPTPPSNHNFFNKILEVDMESQVVICLPANSTGSLPTISKAMYPKVNFYYLPNLFLTAFHPSKIITIHSYPSHPFSLFHICPITSNFLNRKDTVLFNVTMQLDKRPA